MSPFLTISTPVVSKGQVNPVLLVGPALQIHRGQQVLWEFDQRSQIQHQRIFIEIRGEGPRESRNKILTVRPCQCLSLGKIYIQSHILQKPVISLFPERGVWGINCSVTSWDVLVRMWAQWDSGHCCLFFLCSCTCSSAGTWDEDVPHHCN